MFFFFIDKSFGQSVHENKISKNDETLWRKFRIKFADDILKKDKQKFAKISDFPFYCSPCTDEMKLETQNAKFSILKEFA